MLDGRVRVAAGLYLIDSLYFNMLCDGEKGEEDPNLKQTTLGAVADLLFIPFIQTAMLMILTRYKVYQFISIYDYVFQDAFECCRIQQNSCNELLKRAKIKSTDLQLKNTRLKTRTVLYPQYCDEVAEKIQTFGVERVGQTLIHIFEQMSALHSSHCARCTRARQILTVISILELGRNQIVKLSDQTVQHLEKMQKQLSQENSYSLLTYTSLRKECKKNPENQQLIFNLVKLALDNDNLRQQTIKLLRRWAKEHPELDHLQSALILLGMIPQSGYDKIRQTMEEHYQKQQGDPNLELHLVEMYSMLAGAKMYAGEQAQKWKEYDEKKIEHFNRYVESNLKLLQTSNW